MAYYISPSLSAQQGLLKFDHTQFNIIEVSTIALIRPEK